MWKKYLYISVIALALSSCTGGLYSHYPKVKRQQVTKPIAEKVEIGKSTLKAEQLNSKGIIRQIASLPEPEKAVITLPLKPLENQQVKNFHQQKVGENDSATLPTAEVVNKNAKIAFWSSIGILGSIAAAGAFGGFFLFFAPLFALIAFIFAIIALRQIKRTGEYGKPKAEFALILSVPILLIALSVLIFLVAQGGLIFTIGITF